MKPKTIKEYVILLTIVGGIILPVIGFALFLTDRGSPVLFESIGIAVAVLLVVLFWLGLGLLGIIRMVGKAFIIAGVVCMIRKPIAGIVCLLFGVMCFFAALWIKRGAAKEGSRIDGRNLR